MSGLILIVMLVVMVVVLFVKLVRQKPVKNLLISYAVILGSYHLLVSSKCGPDRNEVKIMTPQVEVITEYILKNGVPESLMDIANLPYSWNSCNKATDGTNVEWCSFIVNGQEKYSGKLYILETHIHIELYHKKSETGVYTDLNKQLNNSIIIEEHLRSFSTKNDGICNPMRM